MSLCGLSIFRSFRIRHKFPLHRVALALLLFIFSFSFGQTEGYLNQQRLSELVKPQYTVTSIRVIGNKRTKEKIILRELNFKTGQLLTLDELEYCKSRSQQNLINTSLFNFVTITSQLNDSLHTAALWIDVKERWYTWPSPILEVQDRNFNSWWATKDLFRINYGMYLTFENVRGRNETATLKFRRGYTELYGLSYKIPYINRKQSIGLNLACNYYRNNEIAYATYGNQLLFFRNYRNYVRTEKEAKIGINYREGIYMKHSFEIQYKSCSVSDEIKQLNPGYFLPGHNNIDYFSLQYFFRYDIRDSRIYPLKGYAFEALAVKDGLNLLPDETVDNLLLSASVKNYWSICSRTYMATGLKLRYMMNSAPLYYFNRALGFNDFVRGYEYYVVDGQSYVMFKTTAKYQLIKPRLLEIPVKYFEKFKRIPYAVYLTAYGDVAYVQDRFYYADNPLTNTWLVGCGIGLDLVTYYDTVIRLEASMNKMKQKGIFLHLTAPI